MNADSVQVNARTLRADGDVSLIFTNKSDIDIPQTFAVVLFEDRDRDGQYGSAADRFLGRAYISGIGPREILTYKIPLHDTLEFPKNMLFAFVDAKRWVEESNERNNLAKSGTTCEGYEPFAFMRTIPADSARTPLHDSLLARIPATAQGALFSYLRDNDANQVINENDTLYALYVNDDSLCAVDENGALLFTPRSLPSFAGGALQTADINNDGLPEILAGNCLFAANGSLFWNVGEDYAARLISLDTIHRLDWDRDNDGDRVNWTDSCITIWSGRDSSLLFAYPFHKYRGTQYAVTVAMLGYVEQGMRSCYDLNASYPRYSVAQGDSIDLSIRVGNAGAGALPAGAHVTFYADTLTDWDVADSGGLAWPNWQARKAVPGAALYKLGAASIDSALVSGQWKDVKKTFLLSPLVKRVWFVVDEERVVVDKAIKDNVEVLRIGQ